MFIKRLYREWRLLGWALLLLIAAQGISMYKGIENIPFFLYHMYGNVHPQKDSLAVYLVKTPTGYVNNRQFSNRQQELLYNSVGYYVSLKSSVRDTILQVVQSRFERRVPTGTYAFLQQGLSNNPAAIDSFPAWWGRYFRSVYAEPADGAQVVLTKVAVKPPYAKSPVDSLIFTIP